MISPSILSANFACLGAEVEKVLQGGADAIHVDVMDGHYVPNLTVGPLVCASLRQYGIKAPLDVHLMVKPVDPLIAAFAEKGATLLTLHPESTEHLDRSLDLIRSLSCQVGLALTPTTTLSCLEYVLDKLDLILVMSVNPGFGGQKFIPGMLTKIRQCRTLIDSHGGGIRLQVDGGINLQNIQSIAEAGADSFVVGSALFHAPNYAEVLSRMRDILRQVKR